MTCNYQPKCHCMMSKNLYERMLTQQLDSTQKFNSLVQKLFQWPNMKKYVAKNLSHCSVGCLKRWDRKYSLLTIHSVSSVIYPWWNHFIVLGKESWSLPKRIALLNSDYRQMPNGGLFDQCGCSMPKQCIECKRESESVYPSHCNVRWL